MISQRSQVVPKKRHCAGHTLHAGWQVEGIDNGLLPEWKLGIVDATTTLKESGLFLDISFDAITFWFEGLSMISKEE